MQGAQALAGLAVADGHVVGGVARGRQAGEGGAVGAQQRIEGADACVGDGFEERAQGLAVIAELPQGLVEEGGEQRIGRADETCVTAPWRKSSGRRADRLLRVAFRPRINLPPRKLRTRRKEVGQVQGDAGDLWLLLGAGGALVLGIAVFWAVSVLTQRRHDARGGLKRQAAGLNSLMQFKVYRNARCSHVPSPLQ